MAAFLRFWERVGSGRYFSSVEGADSMEAFRMTYSLIGSGLEFA
jgi:hypothetical protein